MKRVMTIINDKELKEKVNFSRKNTKYIFESGFRGFVRLKTIFNYICNTPSKNLHFVGNSPIVLDKATIKFIDLDELMWNGLSNCSSIFTWEDRPNISTLRDAVIKVMPLVKRYCVSNGADLLNACVYDISNTHSTLDINHFSMLLGDIERKSIKPGEYTWKD